MSPSWRQVAYALLTRLPLGFQEQALNRPVRLACVKHAASVRPEPGSNSPINIEGLIQLLHSFRIHLARARRIKELFDCLYGITIAHPFSGCATDVF